MSRKYILLVFVTTSILIMLAGCAAATPTAPPPTSPPGQPPEPTVVPEPTEPPEAAEPRELVVGSAGGLWQSCLEEFVVGPFEEQFNVDATVAVRGGSTEGMAWMRAQLGNPTFDVMLLGGGLEQVAVDEGLTEIVNWEVEAPNWNDLVEVAKIYPGFGPAVSLATSGLIYNTEEMPFTPDSWYDFWDPRLEGVGNIGMSDMIANYGKALTSWLNVAEGGTQDNFEPAFDKWKELMESHQPVIYRSTSGAVEALTQLGAKIVIGPQSRAIGLAKEGLPISIAYPKEGAFHWGSTMGIPLNAPNRDVAVEFINFWISPEVQVDWAICVNYSPVNVKADLGDYEYKDMLIAETIFTLDWDWINLNLDAWIEKWDIEVMTLLGQ